MKIVLFCLRSAGDAHQHLKQAEAEGAVVSYSAAKAEFPGMTILYRVTSHPANAQQIYGLRYDAVRNSGVSCDEVMRIIETKVRS